MKICKKTKKWVKKASKYFQDKTLPGLYNPLERLGVVDYEEVLDEYKDRIIRRKSFTLPPLTENTQLVTQAPNQLEKDIQEVESSNKIRRTSKVNNYDCSVEHAYYDCSVELVYYDCSVEHAYYDCSVEHVYYDCSVEHAYYDCSVEHAYYDCSVEHAYYDCSVEHV